MNMSVIQGMIISSILILSFVIIAITFTYNAIKMIKQVSEVKKINWILLSLFSLATVLGLTISLIFMIITNQQDKINQHLFLITAILGFGSLATIIVMIMAFLPNFGFVLVKNEKIMFLGDEIKLEKIISIVQDDQKNGYYINYFQKRNTVKKIKVNKTTKAGVLLALNFDTLTKEVILGNETEIYKDLTIKNTRK